MEATSVVWAIIGAYGLTVLTANLIDHLHTSYKRRSTLTELDLKPEPQKFPFTLSDLLYWIIVHQDGTVVKYVYRDPMPDLKAAGKGSNLPAKVVGQIGPAARNRNTDPYWNPSASSAPNYSLGNYCDHTPDPDKPLWVAPDNSIGLFVADAEGIREAQDKFDYIVDCGDVLNVWSPIAGLPTLSGDSALIKALTPSLNEPDKQTKNPHTYKLLKIKWYDRQAPPVKPEFWVKLYEQIQKRGGDLVTNCQGGHGRSGTAFCALMMVGSPDYGSLDAIVHLRALHCARAIEGVAQHEYLDEVAKYLGREANAIGMKEITSFKDAFAKSTKPTAIRTREYIEAQIKAAAKPAATVNTNK